MSAIGFYATQTTGETSPLGNVDKEENRRQDTNRIMICSYCKRYICIREMEVCNSFWNVRNVNDLPSIDETNLTRKDWLALYHEILGRQRKKPLTEKEKSTLIPLRSCKGWKKI